MEQSGTDTEKDRSQGRQRPKESAQNAVPLQPLQDAAVRRIIQVEHLMVGAIVMVVVLVRGAHEAKRNRKQQSADEAEQVVAAGVGLKIAVRGLVHQGVV